jgi:hypothetical protein
LLSSDETAVHNSVNSIRRCLRRMRHTFSLTPLLARRLRANRTRCSLKAGIGVTNASQLQIQRRPQSAQTSPRGITSATSHAAHPPTNTASPLATRHARPPAAPDTDTALLSPHDTTPLQPHQQTHSPLAPQHAVISRVLCRDSRPRRPNKERKHWRQKAGLEPISSREGYGRLDVDEHREDG